MVGGVGACMVFSGQHNCRRNVTVVGVCTSRVFNRRAASANAARTAERAGPSGVQRVTPRRQAICSVRCRIRPNVATEKRRHRVANERVVERDGHMYRNENSQARGEMSNRWRRSAVCQEEWRNKRGS